MTELPRAPARNSLNERQLRFIREVAGGSHVEAAAAVAGYTPGSGRWLERLPAVVDAIRLEVARLLQVEGAPLGKKVLMEIAADTEAPLGVRADCAKTLLKLGGHVEPKALERQAGEKDLTDMSQDELLSVINQCEGELGKRASPVNATDSAPLTPGGTGDSVDILE